jgi:oxygen-independent coproporphyrinogen III oxidase
MDKIPRKEINRLVEKYGTAVPRYTSYPTAPEWKDEFSQEKFEQAIAKSNEAGKDFSLYLHIPFCESQCYFCGCNVVISPKHGIEDEYLKHLFDEIKYYGKLFSKDRKVAQMAWGGGTPTYLTPDQIRGLYKVIEDSFSLYKDKNNNYEYAIEIDPRVTSVGHLQALYDCGFNRLSMGIQDFNHTTQIAINRVQSQDEVQKLTEAARKIGFNSINYDLIYGLPFQTMQSFSETVEIMKKLNPDRIALFNYAHLPSMIPHQKKYIRDETLPDSKTKFEIFDHAVEEFTKQGYEFIGIDHFAKKTDSLVEALKNKSLYRNFQGYTTFAGCDMISFGITGISDIQGIYKQNPKKVNDYYEDFKQAQKTKFSNIEDIERRSIIREIMCNNFVSIDSSKYIAELTMLEEFVEDGILTINQNRNPQLIDIEITELGQFFSRNVASIFDTYIKKETGFKAFSQSL